MDDFTFIVLSYNQEAWIEEHLNSIKSIVTTYADGRNVDLIVADDCSKDNTIQICQKWLDSNCGIFRTIKVLRRVENLGTVHNILEAIDNVATKNFKFLAADDTYILFDIFSLTEKFKDIIYISHVNIIGAHNPKRDRDFEIKFRVLEYMCKKNKVDTLIAIDNYIAAPGVFVPGYMFKDPEFVEFMMPYKYIEDYPMWIYLIVKKKYKVFVEDEKLINYRVGSGMSSTKTSPTRVLFLQEVDRMHKNLGAKAYLGCKYFNVHKYYLKLLRVINSRRVEKKSTTM